MGGQWARHRQDSIDDLGSMKDPGADMRQSLNTPTCADVLSHGQFFVTQ